MSTRDNRGQLQSPEGDKPAGGSAGSRKKDSPNPLWRWLALNTASIQRKLRISQPADPQEREADRVADNVMRKPDRESLPDRSGAAVPPPVPAALNSSGKSLDPPNREIMESRMGQDFSRVRVHTDASAGEAASSIQARAFTLDHDIVFGAGEYGPATPDGQRLLAHELAHVAQQSGGASSDHGIQREAATAGKSPPSLELVAGTLWAKDSTGKDLPPSLDDISQGGVGDCFLFAAMAAVANTNPQKIVNMIKDNGNGTYTVAFEGIGIFSSAEQTVSADFPVGKHGNVTARKALWPLVIEKAYAQEKGGIKKLDEGGSPGTAVDELINADVSSFDPREETVDYIMGKLAKAKEKKWPMTMSAPEKEGAGKEKKTMADNTPGLYFNHAYTIIDIDPLKNRVKLFNPWGHDHPNGDGWMDVAQARKFFYTVRINDD